MFLVRSSEVDPFSYKDSLTVPVLLNRIDRRNGGCFALTAKSSVVDCRVLPISARAP